jgi:hypothetical protein
MTKKTTVPATAPTTAGESLARINATINKISKMAVSFNDAVQQCAIAILLHAHKYGDYTAARTLVEACGEGVRKTTLVAWFVKFGGLAVSEVAAEGFSGWKGAAFIEEHMNAAKAEPWYKTKKEPSPWEGFDLDAELRRVLDKAAKAMKNHTGDKGLVVDDTKLGMLKAWYASTAVTPDTGTTALAVTPQERTRQVRQTRQTRQTRHEPETVAA